MAAPHSNRWFQGGLVLFTAYWIAFIFLDYWAHHPDVRRAIDLFRFAAPVVIIAILGGLISLAHARLPVVRKWFNGLFLVGAFFVVILILLNAFFNVSFGNGLSSSEVFVFAGTMLKTCLSVYVILIACSVLGAAAMRHSTIRLPAGDTELVKIGVGMMVVVAVLFVLGLLGLLHTVLLFILLGVTLLLGWRDAYSFVRATLITPIKVPKGINAIGYAGFFVLFVLVSMNLVHVVRPIPLGYDSITLYVNLASLINDYNGLVAGHQPYNWSLFISLGYLLFSKTAIVLTLSFMGTLLSLFAIYQLSRKWLNVNFALLVTLLFYSMPMANWLSFRDVKIDLGLLFFSLIILLLFHHLMQDRKVGSAHKKQTKTSKKKRKQAKPLPQLAVVSRVAVGWRSLTTRLSPSWIRENQLVVLLGILMGFALGIKLSTLMLFLALIVALWYIRDGGLAAILGGASLSVGLVLLAGLDQQASLRQFHTTATFTAAILCLIGLGFFVYLLRTKTKAAIANLRTTALIGLFMAATLAPWLVKNYSETKSLSVTTLTNGKRANPSPTLEEMDRIWRTQQQNQ